MMFRSSTDEVSTSGAEASESNQTSETWRNGNTRSFKESTNFTEESIPSSSCHQRKEDTTTTSHEPLVPRIPSGNVVTIYANKQSSGTKRFKFSLIC